MSEDETVVLRNSGLSLHLREAGFHDFEVIEQSGRTSVSLPESNHEQDRDRSPVQSIENYQEFEKLIHMVLESHLVFSDDALFVRNFAVHMKPLSKQLNPAYPDLVLKTLFVSSSCWACSACGVKFKPWVLISLHVTPISIFTIKNLYQVFCKRKRRKILEHLLKNLKKLSLLLQKSIQFIYESEIMFCVNRPSKTLPVPTDEEIIPVDELHAMQHLRMSIFHAIRSAVLDVKKLIIILIREFPLKSHADLLSYHLAFLDEIDLQCAYTQETSVSVQQLQKMKYVLLLLQSEFLRQLSICFVPSLWVCNTENLLKNVFTILKDFSERSSNRHQQLRDIFEIYYTCEKSTIDPSSSPDAKWLYKEAYLKTCSLSFNLRSVLKSSRKLEEFLEDTRASDKKHENVVQKLDSLSEQIAEDYARCQLVLDDLKKYVMTFKPRASCHTQPVENAPPKMSPTGTKVLLGVTDFSPSWPDEVFVGVSEDQGNITETEAVSFDEGVPQPHKLFINELKGALQSKAREWKERERIALKNKDIDVDDEEVLTQISTSSEEELSSIQRRCPFIQESAYKFKPIPVAESSFARKIQEASTAWGVNCEEFLGDDDENEE